MEVNCIEFNLFDAEAVTSPKYPPSPGELGQTDPNGIVDINLKVGLNNIPATQTTVHAEKDMEEPNANRKI